MSADRRRWLTIALLALIAGACERAGLGRILCSDLSPEGSELKIVRAVVVGAEQAFHEQTRLGSRALRWLRAAAE